jgi:hypothetical protein
MVDMNDGCWILILEYFLAGALGWLEFLATISSNPYSSLLADLASWRLRQIHRSLLALPASHPSGLADKNQRSSKAKDWIWEYHALVSLILSKYFATANGRSSSEATQTRIIPLYTTAKPPKCVLDIALDGRTTIACVTCDSHT